MPTRILLIEDDPAVRQAIRETLTLEGYDVTDAPDGVAGLDRARLDRPDLVLLDLMLPKLSGLDVLERIRERDPTTPIIILTALADEPDRVRGLRLGADDYVSKPFGSQELVARIEAVLRRAHPQESYQTTTIEDRTIDLERREVRLPDGRVSRLSQREAELLGYLIQLRGRPAPREELLERVWGIDPRGAQTRTVDMAIARLREHLADDAANPVLIQTVRGVGYMLAMRQDAEDRP